MPRLTKRVIDQLRPQPQEYFAWDSTLPGFGVRVLRSGRKSYCIQYRDTHGRTRRYALGPHGVLTPEQARSLASQALARVRAGANPAEERQAARQAPSVADLIARFTREHLPKLKPKTQYDYRLVLQGHILPRLGRLAVPAVTLDDIAALHLALAATPYQANRALTLCRTLFRWAETWHMRPPHTNPARDLVRYPEPKRERYLRPHELLRLGQALTQAEAAGTERPEALALVRLLVLTGARLGEIRLLRWEWIDWDSRRVRLPDSKSGAKTLYLSAAALEVLQARGPQAQGLVLPGIKPGKPQTHPQKVFRRLCAVAGLTDVRPHDLRHTYASQAGAVGFSLPMIGALLGHGHPAATARYLHLVHDPVEQAAQVVGEALAKALGG